MTLEEPRGAGPLAAIGPTFLVTRAWAAGATKYSTAPARMSAPTTSVRTITPLEGLPQWAGAFALALPDDVVFSHLTAAALWELPLPKALQDERGLHIMRTTDRPRIERTRCVHHKGLEVRRTATIGPLQVTSIADTWLDVIAAFHRRIDLSDAVMMGDAAVELMRPTMFIDDLHPSADPNSPDWWEDPVVAGCRQLRDALQSRPRFRGKPLAREALRLIRPRVWSPGESRSRVTLVGDGIPEPELNKAVHFESGAGLIGIVDLHWKQRQFRNKVAGEYQGQAKYASGRASQADDNARRLLLEEDGWKVIEIFSRDLNTLAGRTTLTDRIARWLGLR